MKIEFDRPFESNAAVGVIFHQADGTIQSCNPDAVRILGYTAEQLVGASSFDPPWQTIHPDGSPFPPETHPAIASIKTGQSYADVVMGFYQPSGDLVWISIDSQPLFLANSTQPYGAQVFFKDITQDITATKSPAIPLSKPTADESAQQILGAARRDISDRQRQNEERLNLAVVAAGLGMWFWDLEADTQEWTDRCREIFGIPADGSVNYERFIEALHPDDRDRTNKAVEEALANKTEYSVEYRTIWSDGSIHWILARGRGFYNQAGEPVRMMGTVQNIDERKEREQSLQQSNQRITNILESMTDAFYALDRNFNFTYINQEAERLLKRQRSQLLGKNVWSEFPPAVGTELDRQYHRALAEQISTRFEYYYPPLDTWFEISVYPSIQGISVYFRDITDSKLATEQVRRSEQHLRRVLDSLYSFIGVLNPDGILLEANRTALEAANLQPEAVLGQPFAQTYWWSYSTQSQARLNDAIKRAKTGEAVRYDVEARLSAQNYILIDFSLVPLFDSDGQVEYLIPSGIDISDREASKKALQQTKDDLKLITEIIPQQIWTALPNGEMDYFNQRWHDFTGVDVKQLQRYGWESIVHPDDLQRLEKAWSKSVRLGQKYNVEARLIKADGTYHWFLIRARPLRDEQGEIIKWYATNTDITRIKQLEEQLREQTEDLIRANQLKDDFLAIVSHELRTPLNPILGWSQLLTAGRLDPARTSQGLEIIQRNAKLQAQLIEDLLDVSGILRGKLDLKVAPVNLESVIRSALSTVQLAAEAKSIQVETVFEPNIGQVSGDVGRLQQIVWNLVSNAIKFTPNNGRVTIKLNRIGNQAQIQVTDTGQGIDEEFLPHVFERFRQAESTSTRKFGGLGLGLSIVRHLSELHGGTVAVSSPGTGRGATFSVKLPSINSPIAEVSDNIHTIEPLKELKQFKGIKILVVDDEIDSLDILTLVLEQEGAEVQSMTSAKKALAAFNQATPDLIISDIGMPEIDGYTLITQIRALPQGKNVPAIALTAYAGEVDKQRSIDVGFQKHLAKPIDLKQLITTVTLLLPS